MNFAPGSRLGAYEIKSALGSGGMGEVYRATDSRLGRDVAIKVLPSDVAADADRLTRFEREARTIASLSHPNIVVLHSIEEAAGIRFLTMELIEGRGLDSYVTPGGLPVIRTLEIATCLADALIAAHERGVVHRDLKPANVMITREGRVKMLDFGLAKLTEVDPASPSSETETIGSPISTMGQVLGTVPYMAPEQVRGEPADARTDLFAVGVIVYELLSGARPFSGPTLADLSSSILRDTPHPLGDRRADVPIDLVRLVTQCLEKSRDRRLQTARDLRSELDIVTRALESGAVAPRSADAPGPFASDAQKEAPSIAVLPFVNRSRDEEDEYFADGLADELLTVLAKIRGLRVAARTSSFRFKGVHEDPAVIGQALNVATILEGSVRTSGNRVRISVRLVKVSDGYHLWSETYDRTVDDIFAVQDDIAQSVVKELRATLLGEARDSKASGEVRAEIAAATRGRGQDTEAYRLTLQGRYLTLRGSTADLTEGLVTLARATALESDNAAAWAWMAMNRMIAGVSGRGDVSVCMTQARTAAERALALEPALAEGHAALGYVQLWHDFDWVAADRSIRRAWELSPGNAEVLATVGQLDLILGRFDAAVDHCQQAVALDPLSIPAQRFLAQAYSAAGRYQEAERAARAACALSPSGAGLKFSLVVSLLLQKKYDDALREARSEVETWARLASVAVAAFAAGERAESDAALSALIAGHGNEAAYQVAEVLAYRGERDAAFEWLDRAYAQRDSGAAAVKRDRLITSLHADPRWAAFLRKMRLPE